MRLSFDADGDIIFHDFRNGTNVTKAISIMALFLPTDLLQSLRRTFSFSVCRHLPYLIFICSDHFGRETFHNLDGIPIFFLHRTLQTDII